MAEHALSDAVTTAANQLASMPTKALVRTRQAMLAAHTHSMEQQLSYEALQMREMGRSADYVEGVSAFLETRPAKFTGQ